MADKEMVSAKIADRTFERLEEYADKEGISRSQAIDRMLKEGLDVRADGGRLAETEQGIQETKDAVAEVEQELEQTQSSVDSVQRQNITQHLGLLLGVAWLFVEVTAGIPGVLLTVASGLVVLGALLSPVVGWLR